MQVTTIISAKASDINSKCFWTKCFKKAPRIYVKSSSTKTIYGSFSADEPDSFDGWQNMSNVEIIELKNYINNLNAIHRHLGAQYLDELADYRLRLPLSLEEAIDEIGLLCNQSAKDFDIFEPILSAIIQTIKITVANLEEKDKTQALHILDRIGLSEYKKLEYSREIQAIFSELLLVYNKSEKLHQQAKMLFDKDKSYSPKAIEGMATGKTKPSKWLVACAIVVLLDEKSDRLKSILTDDDLFMLFAKPLLDSEKRERLNRLIAQHQLQFLKNKLMNYQIAKK